MEKANLFNGLPVTLRDELFDAFDTIVKNYREERWEPAELNGGKLCEVVYTIIKGYADGGVYPARASKPSNMVDGCRALERLPRTMPHTIKIQIPRILMALYDVRNNRGVGHTGGDVNPNHMDATYVLYSAKWLMAELIRIFHNLSTNEASEAVELIIEREVPAIWSVDGVRRVMNTGMSMSDKTLLLLYSVGKATEKELFNWAEHSNSTMYRNSILIPGHKERSWEFNQQAKTLTISPDGIKKAEKFLVS